MAGESITCKKQMLVAKSSGIFRCLVSDLDKKNSEAYFMIQVRCSQLVLKFRSTFLAQRSPMEVGLIEVMSRIRHEPGSMVKKSNELDPKIR